MSNSKVQHEADQYARWSYLSFLKQRRDRIIARFFDRYGHAPDMAIHAVAKLSAEIRILSASH